MLRFLKIQNLAVIDQAELEVGPGFICLTGESGAGKSVLIDALLLLAGARASSDLVRTGCDRAIVEAEFELETSSQEMELLEDGQLFLRREVTAEGKSRAFVNGVMVPNSILQSYGELAFEIHGQHGQQRLLKSKNHLGLFESQTHIRDELENWQKALNEFKSCWKAFWDLKENEAKRLVEIDFLKHQIEEIEGIRPCEDDQDLDFRLKLARNEELIRSTKQDLVDLIGSRLGPDLDHAQKKMAQLLEFDSKLKPYQEQIMSLGITLDELRGELNVWEDLTGDRTLVQLENRESELNRLFMKYGSTISEILEELANLRGKLESLSRQSESLDNRWSRLERQYDNLVKLRQKLHRAREKAADQFVEAVTSGLGDLALPDAKFEIENHWPAWPGHLPDQREFNLPTPQFQFLFSSNPGEPPKPLAKVASGGELSRLLIAMINAFQRRSSRLLIFDEIDSGIGGETAHAVGSKLKGLGERHQVFCVTHFAQVARFARQQIKIEKFIEVGRTFTTLVNCDHEARISELARLMGGNADSESLRKHARELIEKQ